MEVRVPSDTLGEPIGGALPICAVDLRTSSLLLLGRDVLAGRRSDATRAGAESGASNPSIRLRIYPRTGNEPDASRLLMENPQGLSSPSSKQ